MIHDYVPRVTVERDSQYDEYDAQFLLDGIFSAITDKNVERLLQEKGISETFALEQTRLESLKREFQKGTLRHPLTRSIGAFNLRQYVSDSIDDRYTAAVDFAQTHERLRGIDDCEDWIDLVWFAERIPQESFTIVMKGSDGTPRFQEISKKDLVTWVKELPFGNADTLVHFPSALDLAKSVVPGADPEIQKDADFLLHLRRQIEVIVSQ